MFKKNFDKLDYHEQKRVKEYRKERNKVFLSATGAFVTAGIIINAAFFAVGIQRIPFTRTASTLTQVYTKETVTYSSNAAPDPSTVVITSKNPFPYDTAFYVGATELISEDTPDVKIREFTEPVRVPNWLINDVDRDELYSRIVHDPAFMAEIIDFSEVTTRTQTIIGSCADDPILHQPAEFVIVKHELNDSQETTRVPISGSSFSKNLGTFLDVVLIAFYVIGGAMSWEDRRYNKELLDGDCYRRLMKQAKGKK